jgi:hypothetical protein
MLSLIVMMTFAIEHGLRVGGLRHFPIHARSSQAIIPSTTARNFVTMNKVRKPKRT